MTASTATLAGPDVLVDLTSTDNDVINVNTTAATALGTVQGIETFNFATTTGIGVAGAAVTWTTVTGAKAINVTGAAVGQLDLTNTSNATGLALANSVDSTGLTGTGSIDFDASGRTGAASLQDITVKLGGQGGSVILTAGGNDTVEGGLGNDNITTGGGNDVITGGGGNDTIDAGAGNDTIDGGTGNNTITGGSGDDTITLNGTVDTVVFNGVGAVSPNGKDTITGFDVGTGTGADILNVSAGLNVAGGATAATAIVNLTATGAADFGGAVSTAANAIQVLDRGIAIAGENYSSTADFGKVFGAGAAIAVTQTATAGHKLLVVQGTDQTQLYFVQADRDGTDTNITTGDVVLVGVLDDVANVNAFAAGNFLV